MDWDGFEHGWRRAPQQGQARSLVVLLHGVGSHGGDLLPLADYWRAALPETAFASLHGSEPFDGGFGGRQWFSLRDLAGPREDPRTDMRRYELVGNAYPALAAMLAAELAYWGLDFENVALAGFSQGSMMALHHVATNPAGAAAVVAYSGRLASRIAAKSPTPLTLVHGTDDEVISVLELERAAQAFSDAGYAVEAYALPGVGHTISSQGAQLGRDALVRALVERPRAAPHNEKT